MSRARGGAGETALCLSIPTAETEDEGMKDPYLTLASYVFGAVLVALVVLSALELVGVLRMPE